MMNTSPAQTLSTRVLLEVLRRSSGGEPIAISSLAHQLDASAIATRRCVNRLVRRGLLQPHNHRLTLRGLAAATALGGQVATSGRERRPASLAIAS